MTIDRGSRQEFDWELWRTDTGADNHALWLKFNLCLQPEPAGSGTVDGGGSRQVSIQDWKADEWMAYKEAARRAAAFWDNRFTLIPPPKVTQLLVNQPGGRVVMPNVECRFEVWIQDSPKGAHHTVRVLRLDDRYRQKGVRSYADSAGMAGLFDSTDKNLSLNRIADNVGSIHMNFQYSMAHEIGHMLGQPHIGVLLLKSACFQAKEMARRGEDPPDWHYEGGENSVLCYGWWEEPSVAANIMGAGMAFSEANAKPWQSVCANDIGNGTTRFESWKAVLKSDTPNVPPAQVLDVGLVRPSAL